MPGVESRGLPHLSRHDLPLRPGMLAAIVVLQFLAPYAQTSLRSSWSSSGVQAPFLRASVWATIAPAHEAASCAGKSSRRRRDREATGTQRGAGDSAGGLLPRKAPGRARRTGADFDLATEKEATAGRLGPWDAGGAREPGGMCRRKYHRDRAKRAPARRRRGLRQRPRHWSR